MNKKIIASFSGLTLAIAALGFTPAFGANPANSADYIIVFKDGTSSATQDADLKRVGAKAQAKFASIFPGATAKLNPGQAKLLATDPDVELVEIDGIVTTTGSQTTTPSWGLDRIDTQALALNSTFNFPDSAGTGVTVYVVDTGLAAVNDLGARVGPGFSVIADNGGTIDCNGHGTHVSGTVAGTNFGVAKAATIVPVRVLACNGSGTNSGVIAGLDWVRANYLAGQKAVVNMSLGGGASTAIDTAVNNLIKVGVTVVVAAGNSAQDACRYSPARVPSALTVGATTSTDAMATYSNFGKCLDLFAPGSGIVSSDLNGGSVSFNGTSMASPHVAGAAALILSSGYKTPAQVASTLLTSSTSNAVKVPSAAAKGTPNKLLFVTQ